MARLARVVIPYGDWRAFLASGLSEEELALLRRHERSGRPLGDDRFIARLEQRVGRLLHPGKSGPKGPWKHKHRRRRKAP